jgi:PEP-CTERM motif
MLKRTLIGLVTLAFGASASAVPTYNFAGSFASGSEPLAPVFTGTTVTGFFTPGTDVDSEPNSVDGSYNPPGPTYSIAVGSLNWAGGPSASGAVATPAPPRTSPHTFQSFSARSELLGSSVLGFTPSNWVFLLDDFTAAALTSDALPTSVDVADWTISQLTLSFQNGSAFGTVTFGLTGVTVSGVPEPGSIALLFFALAVCGVFYRRRARVQLVQDS